MERLVQGEKALAVGNGGLELGMHRRQLVDLQRCRAARNRRRRIAFEQRQQLVDVMHIALGHLGHVGASPHFHRHEALDGEHLQGFAQRSATDAELGSELQLVDPASGLELAREDL